LRDAAVRPPKGICELLDAVMKAPDVAYKYILVTGLLAKCADARIHPRSLQASSSLDEAYDARSLCHGVVVPFEKEHGNLLGLSNEPFLNKPARHPEHDKENPQLRNRLLASSLHDVLEWASTAKADVVFAALVHTLRLGKERAANQVSAEYAADTNLDRTLRFINEFLKKADGGARLVAVWGATMRLLSERYRVLVHEPTQSDTFSGTAGDVEVMENGEYVWAAECKHRPLTSDDVRHGIRKAVEHKVPQYLFVCASGEAPEQERAIREALAAGAESLDVAVVNIFEEFPALAKVLGPNRRAVFGQAVTKFLWEMRRPESANEAAELWNELGG